MPVIRKLSAEIIGQIAAGEVVERPASAVKELVENSIDAGAHNVTVELREGGIKYLRVTDNGCGIPAEQVRLAFERHATSKIAAAADLYNIHTLGFRGEALASIAAVSRVTLTTRTQEAPFGTRAVVEAGEFTDIRQAASPVGTTIVVRICSATRPCASSFSKSPPWRLPSWRIICSGSSCQGRMWPSASSARARPSTTAWGTEAWNLRSTASTGARRLAKCAR